MPITGANLTFTTQFNLTPKTVTVTSTTPFVGTYGIALADVESGIEAIGPDGLTFKALVIGDIDEDVSRALTFALPLDVNGAIQEGDYQFRIASTVVGGVDPGTYTGNWVTFEYCDETPVATFSWEADCYCEPILTLNDTTAYGDWVIDSRTLTLYPPANATVNTPITGAGNSVNTGSTDVYAGIWLAGLSSVVTQDFGSYTATVTVVHNPGGISVSSASYTLLCDNSGCQIRCCITSQYNRWNSALINGNTKLMATEWTKFSQMIDIRALMVSEIECGNTSNTSAYLVKIKQIGECTDDCGDCSDSTSTGLITPICGGAGTAWSFQANNGLQVNVAGNVVTYGLTATNNTKLTNARLYDVTIDGGSASFLSIAGSTDATTTPFTDIFDISWLGGAIPEATNYIGVQVNLTFTGGGAVLTQTQEIEVGTLYHTPTIVPINGTVLSWPNFPCVYKVSGFHVGGAGSYKAIAFLQYTTQVGKTSYTSLIQAEADIWGKDLVSGEFYVRILYRSTGSPMTYGYLNGQYTSVKTAILIFN